jgi:cytochrome c oxidase cbb3-type subunit III
MSAPRKAIVFGILAALVALIVASCKREERAFRVFPPAAAAAHMPVTTELVAGPATQPILASIQNSYEENAYAMSEGKRLYENFNCSGCHFHGGGGIGPPLMDDKWIYGSEPQQIYATIIQGRPNGMPSFRGKIVDAQIWQIVAYVRSMSGLVNKNAAGGRSDQMQTTQPPNSTPATLPVNAVVKPLGG